MNLVPTLFRAGLAGAVLVPFSFGLAGCSQQAAMTSPAAHAAPPAAHAIPPVLRHTPTPHSTLTYTNPVVNENFPDPSLLSDRGAYYAYATNSGQTMPCRKSTDLVHWTPLPDAMPSLPSWAKPGRTWAPVVARLIPGKRYAAYFTAWDRRADTQAIGVAFASAPAGPFVSPAAAPLIAQPTLGGCIDPSSFVDSDGSRYLVWKNDGNSRGQDTWLWVQRVAVDGVHLVGTPTRLVKQDQKWEGNLVEAPTLWKHGAKYYLFYSANDYSGCRYAIGYAVADSLLGPYKKPLSGPWVSSTNGVCGPGGEAIVQGPGGGTWMAYHAWEKGPGSYRSMSLDRLDWSKGVPKLQGPSRSQQPLPSLKAVTPLH